MKKTAATVVLGLILAASAAGAETVPAPSAAPAKGVKISKKAMQSLRERDQEVAKVRKAGQAKRQQAKTGH